MVQQIHLVSQPHTQVTKAYSACAYTSKVRKLADMLVSLGYKVFLYASEENETKAELVTCITKHELDGFGFCGPEDYLKIDFNPQREIWRVFHANIKKEMKKRIKKKDLILSFSGLSDKPIADAFPGHMFVEAGIGYTGVFSPYRIFESYAWQNYISGLIDGEGRGDSNLRFYDEVIPNYFDVAEFPFSATKDDYFLFIGRLIPRKGWRIAQEVCKKLGKRLIVAGQGDFDGYGEYVGMVGSKERGALMSKAKAVFVPTQYIAPFEGVHVEANLCGTPVITTNSGVFTETVRDGFNGIRCGMFRDFVKAAKLADASGKPGGTFNYKDIRADAVSKYSTEVLAYSYKNYFDKLLTLWGKGWYA